jgi:hypothetical protein
MPRRICQGDVFKYINDELHITQSVLCGVIDKVRLGNMVESRISEIKRGKRRGYRGLENKEEVFFKDCFADKDEELGLQKVMSFVKREELVFPGSDGLKGDNYMSYSLRMLKYGLENCELPSSDKNIIENEEVILYSNNKDNEIANNIFEDVHSVAHTYEVLNKGGTLSKYIKDIRENWIYIFLYFICLLSIPIVMNIYKYSTIDLFLWMTSLPTSIFFALIIILAISRLLFGLVDTTIAVFIYKKNDKDYKKLSYKDIYLIAKYGDTERVIKDGGRYDLGINHICYSIFCNITGAFCSLTIYGFLKTMKGFASFVRTHNFTLMSDIGLTFIMIVVFAHSFLLFTREPVKEFKDMEENPDTMKGNRLNVIFNNLHMIVNMYFSAIGITLAFIYSFSIYPEKSNMPALFCFVLISLYLYFWFSSTSPYAVIFNAQCAGSFLFLAPFIATVTSLYTVMCFNFSKYYVLSVAVNVVGILIWLFCLLYKGEINISAVMRTNKVYFSLYSALTVLFYLLWVCM